MSVTPNLPPPLFKARYGKTIIFRVKREKNQQDATNLMFIIKLLSQHVSGIIMSIIRRKRVCTAAYGVLHWL